MSGRPTQLTSLSPFVCSLWALPHHMRSVPTLIAFKFILICPAFGWSGGLFTLHRPNPLHFPILAPLPDIFIFALPVGKEMGAMRKAFTYYLISITERELGRKVPIGPPLSWEYLALGFCVVIGQ